MPPPTSPRLRPGSPLERPPGVTRLKIDPKPILFFVIDFEAVLEPPTVGRPPTAERAGAVEGVGGGINPSP